MHVTRLSVLCFLAGWIPAVAAQGAEVAAPVSDVGVKDVLEVHERYQENAAGSQDRVDRLDDETIALISSYNSELARHEDLLTYNANLRTLIDSQASERDRLNRELTQIEVVRQEIVPLMVEMIEVLGMFIELDLPMLEEERELRFASLKDSLTRSDVELAEKFRRVIDAYQIEADYGQSIEAYEGNVDREGESITVDFLRLGRVALYYMTLDRNAGALWDPATEAWTPLGAQDLDDLDYAIRVAKKQAPPNLLALPLWTRETP